MSFIATTTLDFRCLFTLRRRGESGKILAGGADMRLLLTIPAAALALTGCMTQQPSYAMQQLNAACASGNLDACAAVEQSQTQQRMGYLALNQQIQENNRQTAAMNTQLFANNQMRGPQTTTCTPSFVPGGFQCAGY